MGERRYPNTRGKRENPSPKALGLLQRVVLALVARARRELLFDRDQQLRRGAAHVVRDPQKTEQTEGVAACVYAYAESLPAFFDRFFDRLRRRSRGAACA